MAERRLRHRAGAATAALTLAMAAASCGASGHHRASTTPPGVFPVPAAPASSDVAAVIAVTGVGTARTVTVLVGDREKVVRSVPLPYTTTVHIDATNPEVSVSAQSAGSAPGTTITCHLTPTSGTPTSSSARGAFATATCTLGVTAAPLATTPG